MTHRFTEIPLTAGEVQLLEALVPSDETEERRLYVGGGQLSVGVRRPGAVAVGLRGFTLTAFRVDVLERLGYLVGRLDPPAAGASGIRRASWTLTEGGREHIEDVLASERALAALESGADAFEDGEPA